MFLDPTRVELIHVLVLVIGAALTLRKAAEMGGDHRVKTVVLTTIFSLPIVLFFVGWLSYQSSFSCMPLE